MLDIKSDIKNCWISEGICDTFKSNGWSIHRRNRTSGKARGGIIAKDMSEYDAKTTVNIANRAKSCFRYRAVSPIGEIFSLITNKV